MNIKNKFRPKKSLGQNFIKNDNFLNKLSNLINVEENTELIEIGPGKGALTNKLVKKKLNKILLIEKDKDLYNILKTKYKLIKHLNIINQDAMDTDYENISQNNNIILVGNLPFNISSQLLIKWISYKKWPPFYKKMYLMFQFELGKKLLSKKNNKNYGRITVLCQSRCEIKEIMTAPSNIFFPEPKVDAIVLEITPSNKNNDVKFEILNDILRKAFEKRRKKIKNSLGDYSKYFENWESQCELRPEDLDVQDYCNLARKLG